MIREEAYSISKKYTENKNLLKHMLACEAAMRNLAAHFDEDQDAWGFSGLLHDVDYDRTLDNFEKHGYIAAEILQEHGVNQDIIDAVSRHPAHKNNLPQSRMDWALHIVDPLTGLIVSATLMHPTKKIRDVDTEFIMRRYKEKRFAAGANRDQIALCEEKLGLTLEKFVSITLEGMKSIDRDLGL